MDISNVASALHTFVGHTVNCDIHESAQDCFRQWTSQRTMHLEIKNPGMYIIIIVRDVIENCARDHP